MLLLLQSLSKRCLIGTQTAHAQLTAFWEQITAESLRVGGGGEEREEHIQQRELLLPENGNPREKLI